MRLVDQIPDRRESRRSQLQRFATTEFQVTLTGAELIRMTMLSRKAESGPLFPHGEVRLHYTISEMFSPTQFGDPFDIELLGSGPDRSYRFNQSDGSLIIPDWVT